MAVGVQRGDLVYRTVLVPKFPILGLSADEGVVFCKLARMVLQLMGWIVYSL